MSGESQARRRRDKRRKKAHHQVEALLRDEEWEEGPFSFEGPGSTQATANDESEEVQAPPPEEEDLEERIQRDSGSSGGGEDDEEEEIQQVDESEELETIREKDDEKESSSSSLTYKLLFFLLLILIGGLASVVFVDNPPEGTLVETNGDDSTLEIERPPEFHTNLDVPEDTRKLDVDIEIPPDLDVEPTFLETISSLLGGLFEGSDDGVLKSGDDDTEFSADKDDDESSHNERRNVVHDDDDDENEDFIETHPSQIEEPSSPILEKVEVPPIEFLESSVLLEDEKRVTEVSDGILEGVTSVEEPIIEINLQMHDEDLLSVEGSSNFPSSNFNHLLQEKPDQITLRVEEVSTMSPDVVDDDKDKIISSSSSVIREDADTSFKLTGTLPIPPSDDTDDLPEFAQTQEKSNGANVEDEILTPQNDFL